MRIHDLELSNAYYETIDDGSLTFFVCHNLPAYQAGDIMALTTEKPRGQADMVWSAPGVLASPPVRREFRKTIYRKIGFVLHGGQHGMMPDHAAVSLMPVDAAEQRELDMMTGVAVQASAVKASAPADDDDL